MRLLVLMLIASALGAADVKQLGPTDELPYCRVVLNTAASIDRDPARPVAHDGWWSPSTNQLFPFQVPKMDLTNEYTVDPACIVSVTPAAAQPGRMPAEWRKQVNAYIAKHHPQARAASPAPGASKP